MDFETKFYSAGVPLAATVHIPDAGNAACEDLAYARVPDGIACSTKKYPAVILNHGGGRDRNDGLDVLARRLGEAGIASLRFDFRGFGAHAADRYRTLVTTELPYDLICAVDYLESLPFVDGNRIGMTGVSMGARLTLHVVGIGETRIKSIAPMAATAVIARGFIRRGGQAWFEGMLEMLQEDARINAATGVSRMVNRNTFMGDSQAAADASVLDALMFPGHNAYTTLESMRDLLLLKDTLWLAANVRCPCFVIQGEDDECVAPSDAREIFDALPADNPNKRLKVYPGVRHNIPTEENRETVFADLVNWFLETL